MQRCSIRAAATVTVGAVRTPFHLATALVVLALGGATDGQAQDNRSGGQTATPSDQPLPTTGTTQSRIGPLAFDGGYPTDATIAKLYDEMDFQRAAQAYIWAIPIVSFAKWQEQHENVFGQE